MQREIPVEYIYEEQPLTVLARLVAHGGARIMKNQTRSATLYVYDTSGSTPSSPVHKTALDIDTAIFDTLQTNGWKADRHGYNFRHKLDTRTVFERGGKRFRLEYTVYAELDPALGAEPIDVIVEVILRPVLSRR